MKHDKQKDGKWKRDGDDHNTGCNWDPRRRERMGRKQRLRKECNSLELCSTEERHLAYVLEAAVLPAE